MGTPHPHELGSNFRLTGNPGCRSVALRKILIASDSPIVQRLLKVLLVNRGHIVELADSVEQALSELAVDRFDFVLIDLDRFRSEPMRTVNTFREHRTDNESRTYFIGLATGSKAASNADERSVFDIMIAKPVDVVLLYGMIERFESYTSWMPATANATPVFLSETPPRSHERRSFRRVGIAHGSTELTLSDGTRQACRVIDLSLNGAAIETCPKPGIGTQVKIGRTNGRVVRHTEYGVAVEFMLQGLPPPFVGL